MGLISFVPFGLFVRSVVSNRRSYQCYKMRQPISVLIHPVTRDRTEWLFLLLRRRAMPNLGLSVFWQGVSGGVEDNESLNQAANRELLEETGLSGIPIFQVGFSRAIPMQPEWIEHYPQGTIEIIEHTFVCMLPEPVKPKLSWEHTEFAWLKYREAYNRLFYQGNKDSLSAAYAWLTRRA